MATIGLFGTCGTSIWRKPFIERYQQEGIPFFNPQVDDWKSEDAAIEAQHLAEDPIILFPITNETYATGSLAETGFSILQELSDPIARKESLRARALVNEHLRKLRLPNVYLVDSLTVMLDVILRLYPGAVLRQELSVFNPHNKMR